MTTTPPVLQALLILLLAGPTDAQSPATQPAPTTRASDALLTEIQKRLSDVKSVESDFVEEKNLALLNHALTIKGHFALEKPDRVIWIVNEPLRYAIRVEGDEVRQWDQDSNKVQVLHIGNDPAFQAISQQVQGWLLGDYAALAQNYQIGLLSEQPISLEFTPKANTVMAKIIQHVDLTFAKDGLYIETLTVQEADGGATKLQFIDTHLNEPIGKQTWDIPPHDK
jgi:outer membrane lipoprotein-sorting protein